MRDPRINFRHRELAALLAFLLPGAGHFYQGRRFKAGIYFTCILSLFFAGMVLGDWQPVYSQTVYPIRAESLQLQPAEAPVGSSMSIGYAAQVLVGLPALPALVQQYRFSSGEGAVRAPRRSLNSDFVGALDYRGGAVLVSGQLMLEPGELGTSTGHLQGQTSEGEPVSVDLNGALVLGRPVFGSPRRQIELNGLSDVTVNGQSVHRLEGSVSRPFLNWFQAPRDNAELDRLHGKLSQNFDIACVFTWIAGLLNLMAIWDAYEGPAYGYGDEEPEDSDAPDDD